MALPSGVEFDVVSDREAAARSCQIVRRYLDEALFGGAERALLATIGDPQLAERAWLFWAAFAERSLDEIDVLFANADGSRVACHLTGTAKQVGPWVTSASPTTTNNMVMIECTGTYVIADGKITNFRETWR